MKDKKPSINEWKDLYSAAIEFKNLKCWDFMWDSYIFGVQNPGTGETGYCCIMGKAGEHFALGVYLGSEGLEGLSRILSGEEIPSDEPVELLNQKCLMASFENREYIEKRDYEVIRKLGLRFRGKNEWPLFRSYLPGYLPWYLNHEEVQFLTITLQQAIHVCKRFKNDPEMLIPPSTTEILVRVPLKENGLDWRDEWLEPSETDEEEEILIWYVDEDAVEDLRKLEHKGIWEADFFYFHEAVQDGPEERPYFPYVILWGERDTGLILNTEVVNPKEWEDVFSKQLQENVENTASLPAEILVKKEELFTSLEGVTSKLGIKLTLAPNLKLIDRIKKDMQDVPVDDEDKMLEDVMELMMEDESFRTMVEDGSLEDKIRNGSLHNILKDKLVQSLIEKKRKEWGKARKENEYEPEQTTLFHDLNSNQSKQREFVDQDHEVIDDYHKLIQEEPGIPLLKVELKKLIKKDPDFFDSYLTLFNILQSEGRQREAEKLLDEAYKRAINLITDQKGEWPDLLEWGWVENRHIIRTLLNKAISLWRSGKTDDALDLFRKLLRSNPGDNVGARDYILAIRMKMSFKKFEKRFNKGGFYDSHLSDWFEKNYRKFPDEFDWWDKATEEYR